MRDLKKTLYSLMLSEDVVREVDRLAHQRGTSRSNLVNEILADYVSVTTPERRINDIFQTMESLLQPVRELVPFVSPNAMTMSLKSSLEYKYRPTVKYEVELFRDGKGGLGELAVVFRTQSGALISAMTDFFRLWKAMEVAYLAPMLGREPEFALYEGRFTRTLAVPEIQVTSDQLAQALSDYIRLFDRLLKASVGGMDPVLIQREYVDDLKTRKILV